MTQAPQREPPGARALTLVLLAGVALLLLPYATGLIGAGVLYVVALPVVRWLDPARRSRWAPLAAVFALFFLLVLPGAWLLALLLGQLPDAIALVQNSTAVQRVMQMQAGHINVGAHLRNASSEIVAWTSRQTMTAIAGAMSAILNLVIALFGAYYLLFSADTLWRRATAALPLRDDTIESLRLRFHRTTEAMLLGVVLTGATQGTLVGIIFAAAGLPHPLLWGAVTAAASVLPMFGSALVWVPGVLVLLAQQRYAAAIVVATLGAIIVANVDNALRLIVYRRVSQIHPMVTLVGAFAGVRAFGIAGILVGPLVLSYVIELFKLRGTPDTPIIEVAA